MDILKKFAGVDAQLVKGSGGIFTVAVNGVVVAEKRGGVFPSEQEILEQVRAALAP